jgi:DNA (cytosine-5)-methyltransferase 3A
VKPKVVLSLFDGMSCGQIALNRLGIPIKTYYASEIDPYPIKVTQANYPDTIQLGDVRDISLKSLPEKPDIILAGSPCTGFSFAGKRLAFDDPQSVLFFEFVRLLKEIEPDWFLLENVKMKKEYLNVITEHVGVEPILLNSALVSAQNRWRYYWTNILGINEPEDRGIVLRDILETNPDNFTLMSSKFVTRKKDRKCLIGNEQEKAKTFSAMEYIKNGRQGDYIACDEDGNTKRLHKPKQVGVAAEINGHDILKRVYSPDGKSPTLNSCSGGNREPKVAIYQKPRSTNKGGIRAKDGKTPSLTSSSWQENNLLVKAGAIRGRYNGDGTTYQKLEIKDDGKSNTLTTVEKDNVLVDSEMRWRKLTPIEAERLQTVDDNYTAHVSNSRRYHMLGNGWTIEIICHILKNMVIVEQGGEVEDRKGQIGFEF